MKLSLADFALLTIATFLGTLAAAAVVAWFAKQQAQQAIAEARARSPLGQLGLL